MVRRSGSLQTARAYLISAINVFYPHPSSSSFTSSPSASTATKLRGLFRTKTRNLRLLCHALVVPYTKLGVGKSATVQTFSDVCVHLSTEIDAIAHMASSSLSLIRIEAYRNFITERLSIDPELPNREIAALFASFIVEPFVEKKIGAGGAERWGILLDGLDELEGEDAQCQIIQLIATFVHDHSSTPPHLDNRESPGTAHVQHVR